MGRRTRTGALLADIETGRASPRPLYRQVYQRLRDSILDGRLPAGTRLPSTRTLGADLGISRQTAEEAFAQLDAEGFLRRRVGDGSYVAEIPPEGPEADLGARRRRPAGRPLGDRALSGRGRAMAHAPACDDPVLLRPFRGGLPALDAFPLALWQRLLARVQRQQGHALLAYGEPGGYPPLREAVASYLGAARGVRCAPEQVLILTSSQQALELSARLLLDPGDAAWLEEPGYPGARAALAAAGARLVPVPVDEAGLDVDAGRRRAPRARLAYVTPSHQYPTGATLTLERRLALLGWAATAGAWILEDDYDSEYRYQGRPLAAIQGLDSHSRVLYVGTFSKVLFPSLRLAYLVVPPDLAEAFVTARTLLDGHTALLPQAVLAEFMREGHFAAHVRRMRALYRERRDVLLDAWARERPARLRLGPALAGLHVAAELEAEGSGPGSQENEDERVAKRALRLGVEVVPLSRFSLGAPRRQGLVLGYSGLPPAAIRQGMRGLARALTTPGAS
jgi:GntR family transcriptional regulator / MocR family aminotransferase